MIYIWYFWNKRGLVPLQTLKLTLDPFQHGLMSCHFETGLPNTILPAKPQNTVENLYTILTFRCARSQLSSGGLPQPAILPLRLTTGLDFGIGTINQ